MSMELLGIKLDGFDVTTVYSESKITVRGKSTEELGQKLQEQMLLQSKNLNSPDTYKFSFNKFDEVYLGCFILDVGYMDLDVESKDTELKITIMFDNKNKIA